MGAIYTAKYAKYSPKTLRIKICNANKGARNAQKASQQSKKGARNANIGVCNAQIASRNANKSICNSLTTTNNKPPTKFNVNKSLNLLQQKTNN